MRASLSTGIGRWREVRGTGVMLDSATTHREAFDGLMFIVLLSSRTLNSLLRGTQLGPWGKEL